VNAFSNFSCNLEIKNKNLLLNNAVIKNFIRNESELSLQTLDFYPRQKEFIVFYFSNSMFNFINFIKNQAFLKGYSTLIFDHLVLN